MSDDEIAALAIELGLDEPFDDSCEGKIYASEYDITEPVLELVRAAIARVTAERDTLKAKLGVAEGLITLLLGENRDE